MSMNHVEFQAKELALRVARGYVSQGEFEGSWTMSVYDSAWVSMIQSPRGAWLFPESFQYVLSQQSDKSGWPSNASDIDGILDTSAAILAIAVRLAKEDNHNSLRTQDLLKRQSDGQKYLQQSLIQWDATSCIHVGFEIIVPAILKMLEAYDIQFVFPDKHVLLGLHASKMEKFDLNLLYGPRQTTALHSLEAFIGDIDFEKLRHHRVNGSMLGSPSSTAAYLMNIQDWDMDSEFYLRQCVKNGGGFGLGGVPSAYPSEIFEFTWVLTTFLESGFRRELFENRLVQSALDSLELQLKSNDGAVGFASGMLPDADDTAKSIYLLSLFDRVTSPEAIMSYFMSPNGHVATYLYERTPSVSANCNALICLLSMNDHLHYIPTIEKVASALCDCWWENNMVDKWNLSPKYTLMLLAQAFVKLLRLWDAGCLKLLPQTLVTNRAIVVLTQTLNRLLCDHESSPEQAGSCAEETAYSVLACAALKCLPWPPGIMSRLDVVIQQGKKYLEDIKVDRHQYLWIEKTTYGSETLFRTYHLAALHITSAHVNWSREITEHFQPTKTCGQMSAFFQSIYAHNEAPWKFDASILEGRTFTRMLQACRADIFPLRDGYEDKYLPYISITWILVKNIQQLRVPTTLLWEMMKFSMWDFLADEYMESSVATLSLQDRKYVKEWIKAHSLFRHKDLLGGDKPLAEGSSSCHDEHAEFQPGDVRKVLSTLRAYAREIMYHPSVQAASQYDRSTLQEELRSFLLSHMKQMEDSASLSTSASLKSSTGHTLFRSSRPSFYRWVKTTASTHISCPVSFAFYTCLLGCKGKSTPKDDCFETPGQKYKASDLCAHLAVMSRLFNDYASIGRDQLEGNLNSVNFQEFHRGVQISPTLSDSSPREGALDCVRASLLHLGEYERQASRSAMYALIDEMRTSRHGSGAGGTYGSIGKGCGTTLAKADVATICAGIEMFTSVTELYADMYLARDLTSQAR
ncbi:Ent-kaurene synthase [Karstenula rhodostoma CBS 690.94]|uniref:Ent-kaurene synthase n=1 Tax=Karstenula rhodostoma CBS 690.94 TaxID=1392251 RepID=A0A9P4UHZ4_9PLEO|nr:Ent-kaurene synthase [Karstenula rhodostoma CBS 690.94]